MSSEQRTVSQNVHRLDQRGAGCGDESRQGRDDQHDADDR